MPDGSGARRAARSPLGGVRIAVTRPEHQALRLLRRLQGLGADALSLPAIAIVPPSSLAPLDEAIAALDRFDWVVFTSVNAVRAVAARLEARRSAASSLGDIAAPEATTRPRTAAVGEATARALREAGMGHDVVAGEFLASTLATALGDVHGRRVLLPRGDLAQRELPDALRRRGAAVREVTVYRTVPGAGVGPLVERLRSGSLDAVTFSSPSAVRFVVDRLREGGEFGRLAPDRTPAIICVGPTTTAAARELGIAVSAVADRHDDDGIVDAVLRWRLSGGSRDA